MTNQSEQSVTQAEIIGMRSDMARYFDEFNKAYKEQVNRINEMEIVSARHDERIKTLSGQVKTWNIGNSIAAIFAAAIGWFK